MNNLEACVWKWHALSSATSENDKRLSIPDLGGSVHIWNFEDACTLEEHFVVSRT